MPAQLLTPADLQAFIEREGIDATLVHDLGDTPTVPAAAAALGVEPEQIIKTLLFLVATPAAPGESALPSRPVVVISYGQQRVDKARLAAHWGVGKKRVSLAPADVVLKLLGYAAGGVPPFGHVTVLPTLLDEGIMHLRERYGGVIYGGGGDDHTMLRLSVDELLRVTNPTIVPMTAEPA